MGLTCNFSDQSQSSLKYRAGFGEKKSDAEKATSTDVAFADILQAVEYIISKFCALLEAKQVLN